MSDHLTPPDHVIVIFGANGDLARRKLLPALFHLDSEGLMPKDFRIIGNSRSELTDREFVNFAHDAISVFGRSENLDADERWPAFARRLSYISHEFNPDEPEPVLEAVEKAETELGGDPQRLFYLAVPPAAFGTIIRGIGEINLADRTHVVVEKPFGSDLRSFQKLSKTVHNVLDEEQVYRIDHFLGKESVQNILALRFANGMFEPIWNRDHIDHVQIDVPEELGVGQRAPFYEPTGALRDMVVTHLLQVLALVAMEPPTTFAPKPLTDETVKVFESIMPFEQDEIVRGQYTGYRDEEGVAPNSDTDTFIAAKVCIDNWRWAGVPFYLRTGKRMAVSRQSVTLAFREPPRQMFREAPIEWFDQDHLTLELGADEGITLTFLAKKPGPEIELAPASMVFKYEGSFGSKLIEAYERLIHDVMMGDRTLFTRGDGIERTWELIADLLTDPPPLHFYEQGSWGPAAADELIAPKRWALGTPSEEE